MRSIIANTTLLQNVTVPNTLTINNVTIGSGTTTLYDVLNDLTAQTVVVNSGGSLTLRAGQSVTLTTGFEATTGSYFDAHTDAACSTIDQPNAARKAGTTTTQNNSNTSTSTEWTADIYPNPAIGMVNIVVTTNETHSIDVKAISASGVVTKTMKYPVAVKGAQRIQWDVSGFAPGIYIIQISDGTHVTNKKVIKLN